MICPECNGTGGGPGRLEGNMIRYLCTVCRGTGQVPDPPRPKTRPLKEKVIESKVCEYARKTYSMLAYKWSSPSQRGVPDRIFVNMFGMIMFIEFKASGKRDSLTQNQQAVIADLTVRQCNVFVIDSLTDGKELIDVFARPGDFIKTFRPELLGHLDRAVKGPEKKLLLPASLSGPRD